MAKGEFVCGERSGQKQWTQRCHSQHDNLFVVRIVFIVNGGAIALAKRNHHSSPLVPPPCSMSFICMINFITSLISQQLYLL